MSTLWGVRSHLRLLALVCAALLAPASASAQSTDPEAGSPSGSIYEIPLEGARSDAAPGGTRGKGSSPIRSENGFGSSSTVPGTGEATAGDGTDPVVGGSGSAAPDETGATGEGTSGGGATGGGATGGGASGSGAGPTESDIAEGGQSREQGAIVRQATGTSPSVPRALLLIGLGLLVAAGLAAGVRLANRRG
jgi:hypothetical protein